MKRKKGAWDMLNRTVPGRGGLVVSLSLGAVWMSVCPVFVVK